MSETAEKPDQLPVVERVDLSRKPVVEVLPYSYQPSKAELEEEVEIDATPEELGDALMRDVTVRTKVPKSK